MGVLKIAFLQLLSQGQKKGTFMITLMLFCRQRVSVHNSIFNLSDMINEVIEQKTYVNNEQFEDLKTLHELYNKLIQVISKGK